MNVGTIVTTNAKGQIVIPNLLRRTLGITEATVLHLKLVGDGIYLQPMKVVPQASYDNAAFLALLEKTRGAFSGDPNFSPGRLKKQKAFELTRAKQLKRAW